MTEKRRFSTGYSRDDPNSKDFIKKAESKENFMYYLQNTVERIVISHLGIISEYQTDDHDISLRLYATIMASVCARTVLKLSEGHSKKDKDDILDQFVMFFEDAFDAYPVAREIVTREITKIEDLLTYFRKNIDGEEDEKLR